MLLVLGAVAMAVVRILWALASAPRPRVLPVEVVRSEVLAPGRAVVVGEVVADGSAPVAQLRVTQRFQGSRQGGEWREVDRRVGARAFVIETLAGSVIVDTDVLAIRTPELVWEAGAAGEWEAIATIAPGARVWASGCLVREGAGPYRGEVQWRLLPDGGRIILSSVLLPGASGWWSQPGLRPHRAGAEIGAPNRR